MRKMFSSGRQSACPRRMTNDMPGAKRKKVARTSIPVRETVAWCLIAANHPDASPNQIDDLFRKKMKRLRELAQAERR